MIRRDSRAHLVTRGRLSHRDRFQAHPLPSSRAEKLVYATVTIAAMVAAALAAGSNTGM